MSVKVIEEQERLLQFEDFSHETGIEIGLMLIEMAKSEGKTIAVDITKHGQQIFHASLSGTNVEHDDWLRRKKNTVNHFSSSSLKLHIQLKEVNKTLKEMHQLDPRDYVDAGGGFPINVKGVGCIGAITATGTTMEHEHQLIATCLSNYLGIDNCPVLPSEI